MAIPTSAWVRVCLAALVAFAAGCGSESAAPPAAPTPAARETVVSIIDGDTVRITPALFGVTSVRFLEIDSAEIGGDTQEPWATAALIELQRLLPVGGEVNIETDVQRIDPFGRVLGHVVRADGLNVNREQLRLGHAVLFVIWPNVTHFAEYRSAQIEAQAGARGIWSVSSPLRELPFEYRLRQDGSIPFRPVGDFYTHSYVEAADYSRVHVNNRIFFNTRSDAEAAGYRACARDAAGAYTVSCFSGGS